MCYCKIITNKGLIKISTQKVDPVSCVEGIKIWNLGDGILARLHPEGATAVLEDGLVYPQGPKGPIIHESGVVAVRCREDGSVIRSSDVDNFNLLRG